MEFADFIAPFDAGRFQAEFFGRRPLHIRRDGHRGADVLDWARLNAALAITPYWNEDTLKVYYRNRAALRENYCDTADVRPGSHAPVSPPKLKALLGLGASLVANHIHRVSPGVAAVAAMLERRFASRVHANVYCSFQGVQAFQTHFDLHDVFACQAEGEKTWNIYEARADAPVKHLPPGEEIEKWLVSSRGKLLFEAHMKPGDVLYLPRGQYHDALTGDRASLHVSFGVAPPTGLALFKLLENALMRETEFRAYLPDARSGAELAAHLERLADRVRAVMVSPAFATEVLNSQRELATARADYGLPEQAKASWYSVARRAQVLRRDSGYVVSHEGGEIPLGAAYPAVEWMLRQKMFSLEDALSRQPGADPGEARAALEKLLQAGLVVPTELR